MEDGHEDVDRINQKTDRLHRERGLGVSRARYGMEAQLGGDAEDVWGEEHVKGSLGVADERRVIGEDV